MLGVIDDGVVQEEEGRLKLGSWGLLAGNQ